MKILMISPVNPFPSNTGGRVRIAQIYNGLSKNHDVMLVYPDVNGKVNVKGGRLREYINSSVLSRPMSMLNKLAAILSSWPYHASLYYSKTFSLEVSSLLNNGDFELCYCHFNYTLPYIQSFNGPIVLDQQNVDRDYWLRKAQCYRAAHKFGKYWLARTNLLKTMRFENMYLKTANAIVSVSQEDLVQTKNLLQSKNIQFILAPNGVDTCHYKPKNKVQESQSQSIVLGFFGSLDLDLNREAAWELCRVILPRVQQVLKNIDVSALIVGRYPPKHLVFYARDNPERKISISGTVKDILPYLHKIDILALPLRSGAGTKLRVLEAMSAGLCVVGTSFALMGIDGLVLNQHAFKAETAEEFVEVICQLIKNPSIRISAQIKSAELVRERYDWQYITQKLSEELDALV